MGKMKKAQVGTLLRKFSPEGAKTVANLTAKKEMAKLAERTAAKKIENYQPKRTLSNIFESAKEDFKSASMEKARGAARNPNRAPNIKNMIKKDYKKGGKIKAKSSVISKKLTSTKKRVVSKITKKKK